MNTASTSPQVAHYQHVLDLSREMLDAGMAQDWDLLLQLEQERKGLLHTSLPPQEKDPTATADIVELIQRIQASDRALQEKVEAWLQDARILLRMSSGT